MRGVLQVDGWIIDTASRTAERQGRTVDLSPRAIRLLTAFAGAGGATLSREDLLRQVWPNVIVSDESLTQVVSEIRRKLANRTLIATIAKSGYRLTAPIVRTTAQEPARSAPENDGFTLDAYTLCIEARECFARGGEGAFRDFVNLSAQAVAAAPSYAEARALHALALYKRHIHWSEGEDLLDAILEHVEVALAMDTNNALTHMLDAAMRFETGQTEGAVKALETALVKAPQDAFIHFNTGVILLSVGRRRAAAALVARAAQIDPERFGAEVLLSRIALRSDPARSRVSAERALAKVKQELAMDPHSMRALYSLGPILAQLGDHSAARAALEGVAHHDTPAEYFRALGFAQIGDVTSALERLDFLGMRGWRHIGMLEQDASFRNLFEDARFKKMYGELRAA